MQVLFRLAAKAGFGVDDRHAGSGGGPLQVGAVPYRIDADGVAELLLITSRSSGRWIIPKGWPVKGLTLPESAAREAFEEAGVRGRVGTGELGRLSLARGASARLPGRELVIYPLRVTTVLDDWPERGQRRRRWLPLDQAAAAIAIPDLEPMLRQIMAEAASDAA